MSEHHEAFPALELCLTATASVGLNSTASMRLGPRTITLALRAEPASCQIVLDTTDLPTLSDHTVVAGSPHILLVEEVQLHLLHIADA